MAKSPKTDKDLAGEADKDKVVAQDAIEDAEVVEETGPEDDKAEDVQGDMENGVEEPDGQAEATESPWESSEGDADADEASDEPSQSEADQTEDAPSETVAASTQEPAKKSGGFVPLLLGGIVAGAIGFGAAQYSSQSWPFDMLGGDTQTEDPVQASLDEQGGQIADLATRIQTNSQSIATLKDDTSVDELGGQLRADIVATQARLEELSSQIAGMDERISNLEKMPVGDGAAAAEAASEAYQRELADMRTMLEAELAKVQQAQEEAQQLEVNAAEAANAAAARAAMSRIMAALDSGQPFDDALFDLTQSSGTDAPEALSAVADEGVVTLSSLQSSFPAVARAALDDALRAMVEAGEIGRGEAFLRTQLGTRSLEPKEGDDPDAVLSRAEFALGNGQIAEALSALSSMPEAAMPALSDWMAQAETRVAALDAGAALAQDLNK